MTKTVILGCGYTGRALTRRLIARGDPVRATTTTEAKLSNLASLGAEPVLLRADKPETFSRALSDAEVIIHLAPPPEGIALEVAAIAQAVGPRLRALVYGSTTGAFGEHEDGAWVDESTPPRKVGKKGQARLDYERALRDHGLPLRVVRIAGIYGPGRTLRESIEREALVLFEGGPPTSRIHVEDLARLLLAMSEPGAPPLAIGCDEEPAETIEVARYTCSLLKKQMPDPISIDDAKRVLSPAALEMRLGGRRCRSLVREKLIGALEYPTYREGVRASLVAEGAL
jgi:nucleoside-diphosphate-sugar epimerase